ncbi:hypothetical protein PUN28_019715 [Cardiocondyla obscurior]|uniref:Uncharacterized protein n=1 Tax=Cardiocondyla obscurior TaxID=286306 RepID=A0AAW2EFZ5_9HYME
MLCPLFKPITRRHAISTWPVNEIRTECFLDEFTRKFYYGFRFDFNHTTPLGLENWATPKLARTCHAYYQFLLKYGGLHPSRIVNLFVVIHRPRTADFSRTRALGLGKPAAIFELLDQEDHNILFDATSKRVRNMKFACE